MTVIVKEPEIVDNFLSPEEFKIVQDIVLNNKGESYFPWYFAGYVGQENDTNSDGFYFVHNFYEFDKVCSSFLQDTQKLILSKLKVKNLIRAKANLFPRTENLITYRKHVDYVEPHTGAVFYLNTCNGFTMLEDDTRIESIANRMLIFDSSKPHASTNCTDEYRRVNFNFNFI
tara:strand:- start:607 stop:1125 length:519 start_codon:yes stop_codon:yes gene_type:complete